MILVSIIFVGVISFNFTCLIYRGEFLSMSSFSSFIFSMVEFISRNLFPNEFETDCRNVSIFSFVLFE